MKILHTSDWHLGQNFLTKSRKDEHQAFFRWLLDLIVTHEIDAVIVAGDIFDTGTPPSYAREIYNQFVVEMNQHQCTLVILGGNHDSVATLNESKELLACLNTYVIANPAETLSEQLIELKNRQGDTGAILCAVPFIRPRDVLTSQRGETGLEKRQALGEAIKQHYHDLYEAALVLRQTLLSCPAKAPSIPIIATGHLTALGVSQSESVRDIYIGTLDGFSADGFPPADYIALGHIHRPQKVAKSEHIRYSGSPIPLSFDELKCPKQVVIVAFDDKNQRAIHTVDIPLFHPMAVLKGDLDTIQLQLQGLENNPAHPPTWLFIEVEAQDQYTDLQQRIQAMTEGLNVEVLRLKRSRGPNQDALKQVAKETLAELNPLDVFAKRLALEACDSEAEAAQHERLKTQFKQIVSEVMNPEGSE